MPTSPRAIVISHLGRVEGHGGIEVRLADGAVADVDMNIYEGSRYYEALLRGKRFDEVQGIITRICAICSATHTVAALTALERALGIPRSERIHELRGLLVLGSTIESHALHLFALALPDFLGHDSIVGLAATHRDVVQFALRLKQLGNRLQEAIGGRAIHPINTLVGGFGRVPPPSELREVRAALATCLDPLEGVVELMATLDVPDWPVEPRESMAPTVYVALRPHDAGYRFRGNEICTSSGETHPLERYRDIVREFTVEHSRAKHTALATGQSYVVGALARLRLWGDRLTGRAREAFERLFPSGVPDNILFNNHAQLVELVHCVERGIAHCDRLLELPPVDHELTSFEVRAGRGVGAIEAPRGTLFHEYELDDDGRVVQANVITPTAQNLASVERDLRRTGRRLLEAEPEASDERLTASLETVTRAYDPCISCSVHVTRPS